MRLRRAGGYVPEVSFLPAVRSLRAVRSLPPGARALLALLALAGCVGIETSGPYLRPTPASVAPLAGHSRQRAQVRYPVDTAPAVLVLDSTGLPAPGVLVSFAPRAGSGSAIGSAVRTDGNGIARVGEWVVGAEVGEDTLVATVAGLPATTFVARVLDPCRTEGRTLAVGDSATGVVTDSTCRAGQRVAADQWAYASPDAEAVELTVRSTRYQPFLDVRDSILAPVAQGDSVAPGVARMTLIARPSRLVVRAGTERRGEGGEGDYSLVARRVTGGFSGCPLDRYVTRGVTFASTIGANDCSFTRQNVTGTFHGEAFLLVVAAGTVATIRVTSAELPPAIQLFDGNDALVAEAYGNVGGTVTVSRTAPRTEIHTMIVFSAAAGRTGGYRLDVAP